VADGQLDDLVRAAEVSGDGVVDRGAGTTSSRRPRPTRVGQRTSLAKFIGSK
jgi:hypothetical protein